jgi:hypothetical protein
MVPPALYALHLHAESDGDKVKLEFATVNSRRREELLRELLEKCPGPKSPTPGSWKLVVPSVKVQRGDPGTLVDVPAPKVHPKEDQPPMLRAVALRSRDGAARTVLWMTEAILKQSMFKLNCLTPLANQLKLGVGRSTGSCVREGVREGEDATESTTRRTPPNQRFLLEQEASARDAKKPRIDEF